MNEEISDFMVQCAESVKNYTFILSQCLGFSNYGVYSLSTAFTLRLPSLSLLSRQCSYILSR